MGTRVNTEDLKNEQIKSKWFNMRFRFMVPGVQLEKLDPKKIGVKLD